MFRVSLLSAVRAAMVGCVVLVAAPVLAQTAYFSLVGDNFYGDHGDGDDFVVSSRLERSVGSSETLYFKTFGGPGFGGTNAAGDSFDADTAIDSELGLIGAAGLPAGYDNDYPGIGGNSLLAWSGSDTPLHPDPLPATTYDLYLGDYVELESILFAVDLLGPADALVWTGISWDEIRLDSLKIGTFGGGTAMAEIPGDMYIPEATVVAETGSAVLTLKNEARVFTQMTIGTGGRLEGEGEVYLSRGDPLLNKGVVAPGHATSEFGEISIYYDPYVQTSTGTLEIELGGTGPGQFDRLILPDEPYGEEDASAYLGGALHVSLSLEFMPELGDTFEILHAYDGVFDQFNPALSILPSLPGLDWLVQYLPNSVVLEVISAGLLGDYNDNGVVDAADYTVWRDALEWGELLPKNDPTPESVDESDYEYWKAHFGETAPGSGAHVYLAPGDWPGANSAAAPEPATPVLSTIAIWCLVGFGRRRAPRR